MGATLKMDNPSANHKDGPPDTCRNGPIRVRWHCHEHDAQLWKGLSILFGTSTSCGICTRNRPMIVSSPLVRHTNIRIARCDVGASTRCGACFRSYDSDSRHTTRAKAHTNELNSTATGLRSCEATASMSRHLPRLTQRHLAPASTPSKRHSALITL